MDLNFVLKFVAFDSGVMSLFLLFLALLMRNDKELSKQFMEAYIFLSSVAIVLFLIDAANLQRCFIWLSV